jgi:hypothetical protein
MAPRLDRDGLRAAVYRADTDALRFALNDGAWPENALQLLGDAVLEAARQHPDDIRTAARRLVAALRDRDWEGDAELATQIEATLGWGPTPLLKNLAVDLEELADVLEGDLLTGGGRIDLHSGEVWPQAAIEYAEEVGEEDPGDEDEERWLHVFCEGSRAGYRDMEIFIDNLEDDRPADRLSRAIQGRGAFRRFKDVLADSPDLLDRWYGFSDDRHRGRARAWLAGEGYAATPKPQPTS